ncbi:dynamin family protein [Actinotalea sp. Marseille-Q4924]|uniref:dynamin family protein n=1 Tax=Actinotalea sp. Marseille-Q4924 TaxID=2866571 RepID=UPI001CE3F5D6|nr:dynamin family protein [Actinotalea sp. Marseille-Q4924]
MPADVDRSASAPRVGRGRAGAPGEGGDDAEPRPRASDYLLDAVGDLRRDLDRTRFVLRLAGADRAEQRRRELLEQLDDQLLPRLRELSAPAVVVVAGSTGAGKSTLVNSVVGEEVSPAGVLRPTTRRPVLAHHPADAELLERHPLLEDVDVVVREEVPRGIALVDAPDLDSLLASNRTVAQRLLDAADLWVFVTTAARYGDAVPWQALAQAAERGTSMAMVLNRVPADAMTTVRSDLMQRLRDRGMTTVPLFVVPDEGPRHGLLAAGVVAPVRRWLAMVAGADRARSVILRTQRGTLKALRPWVDELAEAVQAQVDARAGLERVVEEALEAPAQRAELAVRGGAAADGPVRARWAAVGGARGPLAGRWTRRGLEARAEALASLRAELLTSATVLLTAARRHAQDGVLGALERSALPGAPGLLDAVGPTDVPAGHGAGDAAAWVGLAASVLQELGAGDRRSAGAVDRLVKGVGSDGAATLLAAAAAGLGAAGVLLTGVLGAEATATAVRRLQDDLAARVRAQAAAGADPARAVLSAPDLADDAASRLRLRLAVLKGLT